MALVSTSPPLSAPLYPHAASIYSHPPTPSDTRAPPAVAAKLGSPHIAKTDLAQMPHKAMSRDDTTPSSRGQDAVEELVTSTGSLHLGNAFDRSGPRATADDRPFGTSGSALQVNTSGAGAFQASDGLARVGAPATGLRTAVSSGGQTRSSSTPVSRHSPAPSSSSMRSSSSSSVHRAGHTYSASSSSAASSSTSFLPASTPALTPLTPMHFSVAGASPIVSASPQSYFSAHPGDKRFTNGQFGQSPMQHYTTGQQGYPSHSSTFPNPAFPFLPSPHPGVPHMTSFHHHSPVASPSPQNGSDQHAFFLQYQQQWQMEMLKNQQLQQAQAQEGRRRATSGPASHQSPSFYTTPPSYPPSPAASFQGQTLHSAPPAPTLPTLPPGAMLPQYAVHGYPTPPTSQESSSRGGSGGESSASSTGSAPPSRGEAYHPYRRDDHRRHGAGAQNGSFDSSRSAHAHRATPSTASSVVARGHGRHESSASASPAGSPARYTPSRSESATSVHSMASVPGGASRYSPTPTSAGSAGQEQAAFPRSRTDSSLSSRSGSSEAGRPATVAPRHRQDSNDSGRSTTPVQFRSTRTSPLSAMPQNESEDDGAESDATAEATMTVNGGISASTTMTSIAGQTPDAKGQEKGGMKSRFKKAFGVSHSSSSASLTEADMIGNGPKQVQPGWRPRVDSDNMSEASTPPRLPYATHAGSISGGSVLNDGASTTTSRRPPSSNKFRLMNGKFNGSSDNLSISSTVSSASMMIRKIGQMGKLARRNSLMGLTKAFKKNKDGDDVNAPEGDSANKLSKKDKKKAGAAGASVSHATAESMSSASSAQTTAGMSPAAALARQQQLAYAEQEAAEERARRAAAAEAARLGPPKRSFEQLSTHQRTTSTASDASSIRSVQDRSGKSRKGFGFKNRFGLGGSKTDLRETASINGDAASTYSTYSAMGARHEQYDDATPRQSLEVLAPPRAPYNSYGAREAGVDSQEYEPSLYREGAQPVVASRAPRGILKGAGTYRQEDFVPPRPGYDRHRASSFDATRQQGSAAGHAALVNAIPTEQQVDGVSAIQTDYRSDIHPPSDKEILADAVAARVHPETVSSGPYAHTGMNASAPALNHFSSLPSLRPTSPPVAPKRRIAFASSLSVHTTWPATVYDRRAEPATCNRLTPALAQQIKEELNSFKMEEMAVHPLSRRLTHFFV